VLSSSLRVSLLTNRGRADLPFPLDSTAAPNMD
jgi:hypothetical protein